MSKPDLKGAVEEITKFISKDEPCDFELVEEIAISHGFSRAWWLIQELKRLGYVMAVRKEGIEANSPAIPLDCCGPHKPLAIKENIVRVIPDDITPGFFEKLPGISLGRK